jgi:uroporphyrinogen III methyltransferase/synthase
MNRSLEETEKPLKGRNVLLTREHSQVAALARMLQDRGAKTLECPLIVFAPPEDWGPVDQCLEKLDHYDGFLFTSVNAVSFFFHRLLETGTPLDPLLKAPCFAVGPATARALRARNVQVKAIPDRYQAEGMMELLEKEDLRGQRFLFPRARKAREVLTRYLVARSARVDLAVVYETRKAEENQQLLQTVLATQVLDYITFTSTSTVRFFGEMAGREPPDRPWKPIPAACIGEITSRAARELGFETVLTATESTLEGLVLSLVNHQQRGSTAPRSHNR